MDAADKSGAQPLELHPLSRLFPPIVGYEFESLKSDIEQNGLLNPIVMHQGLILDGGNRYRACLETGVPIRTVEFAGTSIVDFVLSQNLFRRHMSTGQQAAIVASSADWARSQTHGGSRPNPGPKVQVANLPLDQESPETAPSDAPSPTTSKLETIADRAAKSGASERTQRMADKVVREDPELGAQVARGEISLLQASRQVEQETASTREPSLLERAKSVKRHASDVDVAPDTVPRSDLDELRRQFDDQANRLTELADIAKTLQEDIESMSVVWEADDKLAAAVGEAKKYREQLRIVETRVAGLQTEKNEAIRAARKAQAAQQRAEKALAKLTP